MNETKHDTSFASGTAVGIGDMLVDNKQRFGALVRQYPFFASGTDMDAALVDFIRRHGVKSR